MQQVRPKPDLLMALRLGGCVRSNRETNPCNCRMASLMFLDDALSPGQVLAQYRRAVTFTE